MFPPSTLIVLLGVFSLTHVVVLSKVSNQAPACHVGKPFVRPVKEIPNNAAMLKIPGPKGWLPFDVSSLRLTFSPPLTQGEDFSIWAEPNEHSLPEHYQVKPYPTFLYIILTPGKKWIKEATEVSQPLVLTSILCPDPPVAQQINSSLPSTFSATVVGNIILKQNKCPKSLTLPDASVDLQNKVNSVLHHCQDPLIIRSRDLNWKHYHSLSLLMIQPDIIFVDGSDQKMLRAANSVDRFLAAHSVLDIVWEPLREHEPQYWLLMPRPLGMPGHLFAMLDQLQWKHPLITGDELWKASTRVNCTGRDCIPGCKHTQLAGISGSGYSADAFNIYNVLRTGFMSNLPMQAFPSTLGKRSIPPSRLSSFCLLCHSFLHITCVTV